MGRPRELKMLIRIFGMESGLAVNWEKSFLIGMGLIKWKFLAKLLYLDVKQLFPTKYLGLPLGGNSS